MTVYAIDPGPHTAIFWNVPHGRGFKAVTLDFTGPPGMLYHHALYCWLDTQVEKDDTIVCEKFEFQKDKRDKEYLNYEAGEYVGVVKYFAQKSNIYYVMQSPVVKEQFWDDDKLRRVGLYPMLNDRHKRDAARHYLYYDTFTQGNQEWLYMLKD